MNLFIYIVILIFISLAIFIMWCMMDIGKRVDAELIKKKKSEKEDCKFYRKENYCKLTDDYCGCYGDIHYCSFSEELKRWQRQDAEDGNANAEKERRYR